MPLFHRMAHKSKSAFYTMLNRRSAIKDGGTSSGIGEPSLYHALIVIFLEFFAWGLLTVPVINVLAETFPTNKFLMNGLILGIKGLLSFLAAPLVGALSDVWGRKFFLLLTVFCTCMPIPLLKFSPWWYFALFSISGVFSVTFSVVLAYVADITDKDERNFAYGLVSATFGASLVVSPALGAYFSEAYSDELVVAVATAIAALDVFFIMVAVPESLPYKLRQSWDSVSWETADPFGSLRIVGEDPVVVCLCLIVFLSYLPEAGQFSCFFVYLKLVIGFSPEAVAAFIGAVGILSVLSQTGGLMLLQRTFGPKHTIMVGLLCQCIQLMWYGFGTYFWMMWAAGVFVAASQVTYPSVSSFVSIHSDKDKQGTVQGMVTGIRGLCQGLGPALFGFVFYLFHVDLNVKDDTIRPPYPSSRFKPTPQPGYVLRGPETGDGAFGFGSLANFSAQFYDVIPSINQKLLPGPPFVFGAFLVFLAMFVVIRLPGGSRTTSVSGAIRYYDASSAPRNSRTRRYQLKHRELPTYAFVPLPSTVGGGLVTPDVTAAAGVGSHQFLFSSGSPSPTEIPKDHWAASLDGEMSVERRQKTLTTPTSTTTSLNAVKINSKMKAPGHAEQMGQSIQKGRSAYHFSDDLL